MRSSMKVKFLIVVLAVLLMPMVRAQNWVATQGVPGTPSGVAISTDGRTIHWAGGTETVSSSTNSGVAWSLNVVPGATSVTRLVCSADGVKVAAIADNGIYVSDNAGKDWTKTTAPAGTWTGLAMTADGRRLLASGNGANGLYQSLDGGGSWDLLRTDNWLYVSCSADGNVILASHGDQGVSLLSTNSGASWTDFKAPGLPTRVSGNGSTVVSISPAVVEAIFVSTNQGASWSTISFTGAPIYFADMSFDGRVLFVGDLAGLHRSEDFGATWVNEARPARMGAVSADGMIMTAELYSTMYVRSSGRPIIGRLPLAVTAVALTNLTFSGNATGALPMQLRWFFDDVEISTNATLALTVTNSGTVKVTAENSFGMDSAVHTLVTMTPAGARVSLPGVQNTWGMGAVVATGFGNTSAWFEWGTDTNYGNVTVATNFAAVASTRTMFVPMPLDLGVYHLRAVVSNAFGMAASEDARYVPSPVTSTMDSGTNLFPLMLAYAWFERGYSTNRQLGLPAPGTIFTSESDTNMKFQFPSDYSIPNAILVDSKKGGVFTLANPAAYSKLSFLTSAGGGAVTVRYTLRFADDSTESGTFLSDDWFSGTNRAFTAMARVEADFSSSTLSFPNSLWSINTELDPPNPRLYGRVITVTNATAAIRQIALSYDQGKGHAAVFAVSGLNGGTFAPISVSGFTDDMIVEAEFSGEAKVSAGSLGNAGVVRALPGVRYEIWSSDLAEGANWVLRTNLISGVKSVLSIGTVDLEAPTRFFKVRGR